MGKIKDLTGQRFGRLTVLEYAGIYIAPNGRHDSKWVCKCDCGNIVTETRGNLKGKTKSCGCLHSEISSKIYKKHFKDLSGQRFGRLTVIKRVDDHVTSSGRHQVMYQCRCDCGNMTVTSASNLCSGKSQSCGCLAREKSRSRHTGLIDLTGQRFGMLTVIRQVENTSDNRTQWLCHCDCGNNKIILGQSLKNGGSLSCGCAVISHGEEKVKDILEANDIRYQREYMFDDLRIKEPLRFDFAVLNNDGSVKYLIEYDGIQHFSATGKGWNTVANMHTVKNHDFVKNQYCFSHNIPLIRIPYTHFNDLVYEDLVPETTNYLLLNPAA